MAEFNSKTVSKNLFLRMKIRWYQQFNKQMPIILRQTETNFQPVEKWSRTLEENQIWWKHPQSWIRILRSSWSKNGLLGSQILQIKINSTLTKFNAKKFLQLLQSWSILTETIQHSEKNQTDLKKNWMLPESRTLNSTIYETLSWIDLVTTTLHL